MATRTIAIANRKGGVGKTTTAINLGHGLALLRYRTLIVDLDSQGNVGLCLGVSSAWTLYDVLVHGVPANLCIARAREYLDVLPSNEKLAEGKEVITGRRRREEMLARALGPLRDYDFILLDCAPSLDILNINALVAANEVIIPVSCDYLAAEGARAHLETVAEMVEDGYPVRVRLILPTFYDGRNRKSKEILAILRSKFQEWVADPIRINVRLAEAPSFKQTIYEYAPHSAGSEDYQRLVVRVLK